MLFMVPDPPARVNREPQPTEHNRRHGLGDVPIDSTRAKVHIEDTDTAFTIGWTGRYRIDGPAFVYSDRESGRVVTILGYPTDKLADTA
jgi:hypothetical protein